MKTIITILTILILAVLSSTPPAWAQASGGGGSSSGGSSVVSNAAPDLSMFTNNAALVAYAFKQVRAVSVQTWAGADANNYEHYQLIDYTNKVKSLDTLATTVGQYGTYLDVVDTTNYVSVYIECWATNNWNEIRNDWQSKKRLFTGSYGGIPERDRYGNWSINAEVGLQLAGTIWVPMPNVIDARLVTYDRYGNAHGKQLPVSDGCIGVSSDFNGGGTLVLTEIVMLADGYYQYRRRAFDLVSQVEVPITEVLARVLIVSSEDIKSFRNKVEVDPYIWSWTDYQGQEYGKNPLIIVTYDTATTNVLLSVTTGNQHATSFTIENAETQVKSTVVVPAGLSGVRTNFSKGTFYVVPNGLSLRGYYYGGGGKG